MEYMIDVSEEERFKKYNVKLSYGSDSFSVGGYVPPKSCSVSGYVGCDGCSKKSLHMGE